MKIDAREEDIQDLCKSVLEIEAEHSEDRNGIDYYNCPICDASGDGFDLSLFKHDSKCGYLIAKDLQTNSAK